MARRDRRFSLASFGTSPGGRDLPLVVMSAHGAPHSGRRPQARAPGGPDHQRDPCRRGRGKEAGVDARAHLSTAPLGELLAELTLVSSRSTPRRHDALDPENASSTSTTSPGSAARYSSHARERRRHQPQSRLHAAGCARVAAAVDTRSSQPWAPELTIYTHSTNGSVHRFAMTLDMPTHRRQRARRADRAHAPAPRAVGDGVAPREHSVAAGLVRQLRRGRAPCSMRAHTADPTAPVGEGWMTYTHTLVRQQLPRPHQSPRPAPRVLLVPAFEERVHASLCDARRDAVLRRTPPRRRSCRSSRRAAGRASGSRSAIGIDAFAATMEIPTPRGRAPPMERRPAWTISAPREVRRHARSSDRPRRTSCPWRSAGHHGAARVAVEPAPARADVEVARVVAVATQGGPQDSRGKHDGARRDRVARAARTVPGDALLVAPTSRSARSRCTCASPRATTGRSENG